MIIYVYSQMHFIFIDSTFPHCISGEASPHSSRITFEDSLQDILDCDICSFKRQRWPGNLHFIVATI